MPRFLLSDDRTYIKIANVHDTCYKLVVPESVWSQHDIRKITQHSNYWLRNMRKNKTPHFKYGTVEEVTACPVGFKCNECNKVYKTRSGLLRHIKSKHSATDIVTHNGTNPMSQNANSITNNTTINNNNNIQQNIIIRPFGDENPKWITEKVIIDALRNMPNAIMNLVKEKHFNDKFPENHNVGLCSEYRGRYLTIQEKGRKRIGDKNSIFMEMCSNACDAVTTTLDSYIDPPEDNRGTDESAEDKRCRVVANRIRKSSHLASTVDTYINKWQQYVSTVEPDQVLKDADHYITMLLLDLKLALEQKENTSM